MEQAKPAGRIDVISDAICPWCYIGKRHLEGAIDILEKGGTRFSVAWHPFQLNPDMPKEGMARGDYLRLKFGDARGAGAYERIVEAGAGEGIPFDFDAIKHTPNTFASHRLVRHAGEFGLQLPVVEGLFQAYFSDGRDVGDVLELLDIGAAAGLERGPLADYLESGAGVREVREEDENARRMGVQGVPCFIFERKYVVSGAQAPEVFLQVFEMLDKERSENAESVGQS